MAIDKKTPVSDFIYQVCLWIGTGKNKHVTLDFYKVKIATGKVNL